MASEPIRDPVKDRLLTPKNAAFVIIDYQPVQVNSIASMDRQLLINNIVGCCKAAVAYDRIPQGGGKGRPQEAHHDGALDRGVPHLPLHRCPGGRL